MICSNFTVTKCLLNDTMIKEQNIANKSKKEVCIIKNKTDCATGDIYAQGQILIIPCFLSLYCQVHCFRINAGLKGHSWKRWF